MKIIIGIEFDIEPDEILGVLREIEDMAYRLDCEQVLIYQDSGGPLQIGHRGIFPHAVFWTVTREGENGEDD